MGSIAKKMRRQLHDAIRKAGATLAARVTKRAAEKSTIDDGPGRYASAPAGMLTLRGGRFTLPDESECWVFAGHKRGLAPTDEERHALDAAVMSAARKSAGDGDVGPVQGPRTVRDEQHAVIVYAWRIGASDLVVEPEQLNHLARLMWRKVSGKTERRW